MRKIIASLAAVLLGLAVSPVQAQRGGMPQGGVDAAMAKLFGENTRFSATMEFHMPQKGQEMEMAGSMAYLDGKSRFEMDMSSLKGGSLPPQAAAQMKAMGMTKMATVSVPETKMMYIIYPDLKAYVEMPAKDPGAAAADYKSVVTKLGTETVSGHDSVKNKVVVTGPDGKAQEYTVWNANDLKQFPVKVVTTSAQGQEAQIYFKDVKLEKPDSGLFDVPAGYTKYKDMMSLMMSRMQGAGAGGK